MGRWKGSPQGPYWDPNDTGPNQVDPPPGMSPNGPQQQPQAPMPNTDAGPRRQSVDPNAPGYDPGVAGPLSTDFSWSLPPLKQYPGGIASPIPNGTFWEQAKNAPPYVPGSGPAIATDQYTKESAPIGYFYPGGPYGDKSEYYRLHPNEGGGFTGSLGGGSMGGLGGTLPQQGAGQVIQNQSTFPWAQRPIAEGGYAGPFDNLNNGASSMQTLGPSAKKPSGLMGSILSKYPGLI